MSADSHTGWICDQAEEAQLRDQNVKMLDNDIALEALGVVCNATVVSSVQQQSAVTDLQAASSAFGHLSVSRSAAPTQLFLNHLIWTVWDGEQTCPVARSSLAANLGEISGGRAHSPALTAPNAHVNLDAGEKNGRIFVVDEDDFFDPGFNCDFTGVKDTETYYRGGEKYQRPCGWQRFALKVLDKYDGNDWLGTTDRFTDSVEGEWPVSYHGTSDDGAEGIIKGYYKPGPRKVYGPGIYSTPDIKVAFDYSKRFTSKRNGKKYNVILQNRINPKYRKIHKTKHGDYWLVEIDDKLSDKEKKKMVERAIRPYGLLLKEV